MKKYFGIVQSAHSKEELWSKTNFARKLPKWIYYRVVAKRQLWPYKEIYFEDELVGYEIVLPLLRQEFVHSNKGIQTVIQSLIQWLQDKEIIIVDTEIEELRNAFPCGDGNRIHPFFLMQWIHKLVKQLSFYSQELSIAVVDGLNKETDLVIDVVYPYVNDLRILTTRLEYFHAKGEEIFGDVGLFVQIDERPNKILSDVDIIISLSELPISIGYIKKGAVYIDLSCEKKNVRELNSKRHDVLGIDDASYILDNNKISSKTLEMHFFANSLDYRMYVQNPLYSFEQCRDLYDSFTTEKIQSNEFFCESKEVSAKLFHKTCKNTFDKSG